MQARGGDSGNQWNGAYYGGHMYEGYSYMHRDPNMYAATAAYGAYPFYGQQVS